MRKGIVMELEGEKAVVLTNEGAFEKLSIKKSQQLKVGDEIHIPIKRKVQFNKTFFSLASAAILFLVLTFSFTSNPADDVAAYVSIDINPSLEAGVNLKMEVVELSALNDDGKKIIQQLNSYDHVPIDSLINEVVNVSETNGYLKGNKDVLITTTLKEEKTLEMDKKLEKRMENLETKLVAREINVESLKVDKGKREKAKKEGMSAGRYLVYLESVQGDEKEKITLSEAKQLSISTLYMKLNKDNDATIAENNEEKSETPQKEKKNSKTSEDQKLNVKANNKDESNEEDRVEIAENKEEIEKRKQEMKEATNERKQEIKERIEEKKEEIQEKIEERKEEIEERKEERKEEIEERKQEKKEDKESEKEARKDDEDDDDEDNSGEVIDIDIDIIRGKGEGRGDD